MRTVLLTWPAMHKATQSPISLGPSLTNGYPYITLFLTNQGQFQTSFASNSSEFKGSFIVILLCSCEWKHAFKWILPWQYIYRLASLSLCWMWRPRVQTLVFSAWSLWRPRLHSQPAAEPTMRLGQTMVLSELMQVSFCFRTIWFPLLKMYIPFMKTVTTFEKNRFIFVTY